MTRPTSKPSHSGPVRRAASAVAQAVTAVAVTLLVLSIVGTLIRDRWVSLSLLMHLPGPLMAMVAIAIDAVNRGRTLRGPRWALVGLALVSVAVELPWLVGRHPADARDPARSAVRVVHWNVLWGKYWGDVMPKLIAESPDVVVLSESPWPRDAIETLRKKLGAEWHVIAHDTAGPPAECTTRVRVLSRYPMRLEKVQLLPLGSVAIITIDAPTGPLRLMTADGLSGFHDKSPLLKAMGEFVAQNQPVDLICGDFNTPSKSVMFSAIESQGYREVKQTLGTVRTTWPCGVPLFGIDHVFVSEPTRILAASTFGGFSSDHRATLAVIQPPVR